MIRRPPEAVSPSRARQSHARSEPNSSRPHLTGGTNVAPAQLDPVPTGDTGRGVALAIMAPSPYLSVARTTERPTTS